MTTDQERWELFAGYYGHDVNDIAAYQRFAGLPQTGQLDLATLDRIGQKRCGVRDTARLTLPAGRAPWPTTELTYRIDSYVPGINRDTIDGIMRDSFAYWAEVSSLRFTQVPAGQRAHIIYSTGRGPRAGFDGPSGILAMMELPDGSGRPVHGWLDLDEQWVYDPNRDIYILSVLVHEHGHAFGLDHDTVPDVAVMDARYNRKVFKPMAPDIQRIRAWFPPLAPAPGPDPIPVPPSPTPGGFMSRELVAAIVKIAVGTFASYAAGTTKGLIGMLDDYAAKWLQANESLIVDLIMARFAGKAAISEADVALALAEIKAEAISPLPVV